MHLDLSTLQIPDVSVVPEPTAEDLQYVNEHCCVDTEFWKQDAVTVVMFAALRLCRALEAANKEHWPFSDPSSHQKRDILYQLCKRIIGDKPNQWLSEAAIETIETLEAEIERLKSKKCPHDLAREFSKETTSGY